MVEKIETVAAATAQTVGLRKLREPFPPNQIGKLPKGGVMLDFVGHGFITARLLDVDPHWNWEPFAYDADGLPKFDESGGLWIRLTVCDMTRIGYGDASGRKGPNAVKEAIGDALRNAAMRFGAALELWVRGELDMPGELPVPKTAPERKKVAATSSADTARGEILAALKPYGWTPDKLLRRFTEDHGADKSLLSADEATVRAFGTALEEEAMEQEIAETA